MSQSEADPGRATRNCKPEKNVKQVNSPVRVAAYECFPSDMSGYASSLGNKKRLKRIKVSFSIVVFCNYCQN